MEYVQHFKKKSVNLRQRGQFLSCIWVPEVDPPAGATEGSSGEKCSVWREVAGGQQTQCFIVPSRQVPDERI